MFHDLDWQICTAPSSTHSHHNADWIPSIVTILHVFTTKRAESILFDFICTQEKIGHIVGIQDQESKTTAVC